MPEPEKLEADQVLFARVMEAVNEVLNSTIDEFKETMREEVRRETQTIVTFAKKELEETYTRTAGQIDKLKTEAAQEMKSVSAQSARTISKIPEQIRDAIEAGMMEVTCTVEKYKRHIELAGNQLTGFQGKLDELKKEISTAAGFVKDLVTRGYSPEVLEKQMRDRVSDVATLQGQINGLRDRNGHRREPVYRR